MIKSHLNGWHSVSVDKTDGFRFGYGVDLDTMRLISRWLADNNIDYYQYDGNSDYRFKCQDAALLFKLTWA